MIPSVRLYVLLAAFTLLQCFQLVVTSPARAQFGGILIEMYGMIQFGPGSQVLTLDVGGQTVRFMLDDLESRNPQFPSASLCQRRADEGLVSTSKVRRIC